MAWIGDLDGDEIADIATGSSGNPYPSHGSPVSPARVVFLSGADLRELAAVPLDYRKRHDWMDLESLPDLDGDGIGELLFGAGTTHPWGLPGVAAVVSPGSKAILSRPSNSLRSTAFGWSVATGNFDGDGRPEIAVGGALLPPQVNMGVGFVQVFDL